jgi:LCP family protein required for cell wall assembly
MEQKAKKQKRPIVFNKTAAIILAVFLVLAVGAAAAIYNISKDLISTWSITDLEGVPVAVENTPNPDTNETEASPSSNPVQIDPVSAAEPWDGVSRITVLLMGLDYRDWKAGETPRTDTMILLSMDPLSKTASIMSIPRDMWVSIPGFESARINMAYYFGELYDLPGGGPTLAAETVEQFLGVPVDYYAQIDFSAFERFIDEIEGVKVHPETDVKIDPIGDGYKQVLKAGEYYTLSGDLALGYARARYTEGGDFDRAKRQQEVIMSIRDRILDYKMMPKLIAKAPILYQEISSGIKTNLSLDQVIRLATSAMNIEREDIKTYVIDATCVEMAKTPDGSQDILIPIPDRIRILRDEAFTTGGPLGPAAVSNVSEGDASLVGSENARVSIQNGSWLSGLAGTTSEYLKTYGFNVLEAVDGQASDATTIYLYNAKPYTVQFIFDLFEKAGLTKPKLLNRVELNSNMDVVIVLGNDWANYINANSFPQN